MGTDTENGHTEEAYWYVMRDLKRRNAKNPAYSMLEDAGFEVFTPMKWEVCTSRGRKVRERGAVRSGPAVCAFRPRASRQGGFEDRHPAVPLRARRVILPADGGGRQGDGAVHSRRRHNGQSRLLPSR